MIVITPSNDSDNFAKSSLSLYKRPIKNTKSSMIKLLLTSSMILLTLSLQADELDTLPKGGLLYRTIYKSISNCDCELTKERLELGYLDSLERFLNGYHKRLALGAIGSCMRRFTDFNNRETMWDTIRYNKDFILLDILLDEGIDISEVNRRNETLIFTLWDKPRGVVYYVEKGGDLNVVNHKGKTILDKYIDFMLWLPWSVNEFTINGLKAVTYLVENGANSVELDMRGVTSIEERRQLLLNYLIDLSRREGYSYKELEHYLLENGLPKFAPVLIGFPDDWNDKK